MNIRRRKRIFPAMLVLFFLTLVCIGIFFTLTTRRSLNHPPSPAQHKATHKTPPKDIAPPLFDKDLHSTTQAGSLWWIVNKNNPTGDDYTPPSLIQPSVSLNELKSTEENSIRADIAPHIQRLFEDAKQQGYNFIFASGYRSHHLQSVYYNNYVKTSGQAEADRYSARPGTSEHQTGLSFDIARMDRKNYLEQAFGNDPEGQWLATHAHTYGFIIRYPEGKESITGYMYEPWHLRYVGTELASELHRTQQTMEEFFGTSQ